MKHAKKFMIFVEGEGAQAGAGRERQRSPGTGGAGVGVREAAVAGVREVRVGVCAGAGA